MDEREERRSTNLDARAGAVTHGVKRAFELIRWPREISPIAERPASGNCRSLLESLDNLDGNHVSGPGLVQRKTGGDSDKIAALDETQLD